MKSLNFCCFIDQVSVFFTVSQCHSELAAYVAEEMFSLDQEILALSDFMSKVENELQETMKFAGQ